MSLVRHNWAVLLTSLPVKNILHLQYGGAPGRVLWYVGEVVLLQELRGVVVGVFEGHVEQRGGRQRRQT